MKREFTIFDFGVYFFSFFPFLKIIPIASDMQPYALVFAIVYLLFAGKVFISEFHIKLSPVLLIVFFMLMVPALFVNTTVWIGMLRKSFNYISFFFVSLAVYNSLKRTNGLNEKLVKCFICLWSLVSLIQLTYNKYFLSVLVSNFRTSPTRGVNGLASEPSFYGYMAIFFLILSYNFKKQKRFYQVQCVLQIVIFAQSAVSVVYLAVFFVAFLLEAFYKSFKKPKSLWKTLLAVGAVLIGIFSFLKIANTSLQNTRMVELLQKIAVSWKNIHTVQDVYLLDQSVGERVDAIVTAFSLFAENYAFPQGFLYGDITGRIMSGYGVALYELGFFGLAMICIISIVLYKGFENGFVILVSVTAMMFSAVQFGTPMFAFICGYALYNRESALKKNQNSTDDVMNIRNY